MILAGQEENGIFDFLRHGQAKILTQAEIQLLFSQGLESDRDRALCGCFTPDYRPTAIALALLRSRSVSQIALCLASASTA
jgi:hypothetical protein